MTKQTLQVLIAAAFLSGSGLAATERVVRFQNTVRVGYDDNIYSSPNEVETMFVSDVINLSAKLNFSSRTDALLYWEPEFRYRFDAEPKFLTYQTLYARLSHALSQRAFLTLSDRFRYQEREAQAGSSLDSSKQNYVENDLKGALDYTLNEKSYVGLGLGYVFRIWDDSSYGEWNPTPGPGETFGANNFNMVNANLSYNRQLKPNRTLLTGGVNYGNLAYDGDRGGYDTVTLLAGVDQNFSSTVSGFGRLGYSLVSIESFNTDGEDTSSPYLQAGLEVTPSSRTSLTTSLGYTLSRSDNSAYNAQDRFVFSFGSRHDVTSKIAFSGTFNYIYSIYDSAYSSGTSVVPDAKDNFFSIILRCSYQINRNNFLDLGYRFRVRSFSADGVSSSANDWDGNRLDLGWRLRL